MLCIKNYSEQYISESHLKIDLQISYYRKLCAAIRKQEGQNASLLDDAMESFEPVFFNHMVLVLDNYFVHRSKSLELKDGNPLNEVRVICNSIMNNNSHMIADKSIKLDPDRSILKIRASDTIQLNEEDFTKLSNAFFAEIEKKYS